MLSKIMAHHRIEMALVLVLVTIFWTGTKAQTDCSSTIISMSPCLNYITGNASTPAPACCSQLANVVQSQPQCLCQALNGGGASLGITINQTRAAEMPGACKVQTPPLSSCNAVAPTNSPNATPATPPTATPKNAQSPGIVPSGSGSKTAPNTNTSDASSTKLVAPLFLFLLFVASYISTSITC